MPKNDERTQFEYKDHDPTRYAVESIIDFVPLKFVPDTKVFRLDAGTVEALTIAVKHHDDMDTPVESTLKKPATREPARKSKKPAARETASKRRRSARASREEEDDEDEQEQESEEDNEEREEEEDARLKAPSTQQSSRKAKKGAHDAACGSERATMTPMTHASLRLEGQRSDHTKCHLWASHHRSASIAT